MSSCGYFPFPGGNDKPHATPPPFKEKTGKNANNKCRKSDRHLNGHQIEGEEKGARKDNCAKIKNRDKHKCSC